MLGGPGMGGCPLGPTDAPPPKGAEHDRAGGISHAAPVVLLNPHAVGAKTIAVQLPDYAQRSNLADKTNRGCAGSFQVAATSSSASVAWGAQTAVPGTPAITGYFVAAIPTDATQVGKKGFQKTPQALQQQLLLRNAACCGIHIWHCSLQSNFSSLL